MKVYHYTHLETLPAMKAQEAITPESPVGIAYEEAKNTKALFALLEPEPESWVKNKQVWFALHMRVGDVLTEIEVDETKDGVFVLDRTPMEVKEYTPEHQEEAERAYLASKVPLKDYMDNPRKYAYELPEVIITTSIPQENVSISKEQPRLTEMLEVHRPWGERGIKEYEEELKRIPELATWLEEYNVQRTEASGEMVRQRVYEKFRIS